jgi:hypothetical protein
MVSRKSGREKGFNLVIRVRSKARLKFVRKGAEEI